MCGCTVGREYGLFISRPVVVCAVTVPTNVEYDCTTQYAPLKSLQPGPIVNNIFFHAIDGKLHYRADDYLRSVYTADV